MSTRDARPEAQAGAARSMPTTIGFSLVFLASFVAVLAGAVLVNVLGNSTKLFPARGFPPSACNRAWKSRRAEELARAPDSPRALVIGSSRVIPLQEKDVQALTGLRTLNFGVDVGCPVDYLAELRFALRAGLVPTTLVIGVDELAFGDNPEADIYDMQLLTHDGLFREVALRDRLPILKDALETVSLSSTTDAVRNLWRRWGKHEVFPPDEPEEMKMFKSAAERKAHLAEGVERLATFWGKYLDRPDKVEGMRPTRRKLQLWEELLDLAAAQGSKVYVALLPVHPELERRAFSPRVLEIRTELRQALEESCRRHGATFLDATSLASFGGDSDAFEDGTHMSTDNGRLLLEALLERPRTP